MSERPALARLAERLGILPAYHRADSGQPCLTSDGTREALAAAMGHDASTEAAAERALEALEDLDRSRLLAPTSIMGEGHEALRLAGAAERLAGATVEVEIAAGPGEPAHERRQATVRHVHGSGWLDLPGLATGRHELSVRYAGPGGPTVRESRPLHVVPARCTAPAERLGRPRGLGLWANLYSVRGADGIGHLGEARRLLELAGRAGLDFVGLNPLHHVRADAPATSPYGPVTRLFRSPLYLDLGAVPELAESARARALLASREAARLRDATRLDYRALARFQEPVLAELHATFRARHLGRDTQRGRAHAAFAARGGALLERFATFLALDEAHPELGDWRRWPEELRRPASPAVAAFREAHRERVDFHGWVQLELERQLLALGDEARERGVALGLYQDLAVGSAPSGFDAWAFPDLLAGDVTLGAPPDAYAADGQDWGLTPLDPHRLLEDGCRFWTLLLERCLAGSGALRIDHVLGLVRQFWIPSGAPATAGAYVRFPGDTLLALAAAASRAHGAPLIGEDLGTVPEGMRETLAHHGLLGSRVMLFERDAGGAFLPADRYAADALATVDTHDHPPLRGWLAGSDLELRHALGQIAEEERLEVERAARATDRLRLVERLVADGLLPADRDVEGFGFAEIRDAAHAFLARGPASLVGLSLDDLAGEEEPVNLPGVPLDRHPSWTRRMRRPLDELLDDPALLRALKDLAALRR